MDGLCHGNSEILIEVDDMDDDWGYLYLWKPLQFHVIFATPFSWAISQPGQVLEVRGAAKWAAPAQPVPGPVTE